MNGYVTTCQTKPLCQTRGVNRRNSMSCVAAKYCIAKVTKSTPKRISRSRGIGPVRPLKPPEPPKPGVVVRREYTVVRPPCKQRGQSIVPDSSRVADPLPQLLEGRLLPVHEDADPVDAGADPDHSDEKAEGQGIGQEDLPERRHLQRDP